MAMYLGQGLSRAVKINRDGVSTIDAGRRRTWAETADRIARLAAGLVALGIGKGDRVAVLAMNGDRYFELMYAVPMLGGIIVPLNIRLAAPEIGFALEDSGAAALVLDRAFATIPAQLGSRFDVRHFIYVDDDVPAGMLAYESVLREPMSLDGLAGGDDVAGIFYTGGTTGRSKGVMLTHRNLVSNAIQAVAAFGYRHDSRYIHAAPMFHLADGASTFAITIVGGTHVFVPRFEASRVLEEIERHQVTNALLVPTMIAALADHPDVTTRDLSTLRLVPYGASPMPEAVLRRATRALPHVQWLHVYGMTEAAPLATAMDKDLPVTGERERSCGRPALLCDIRICDADDEEVPRGTVGEVHVRGPNVMLGYWRQPEVTAHALRGGWYHSGDGGYMDRDGYIYIVDRMKDMIITGGENVYSAEVESAISILAGVAEVAVIGIPDERWGETIHAVVVPRAGVTLTADAVIAHARSLIAAYKCPRSVEIRETPLPLSGAGKVLKTVLREPFWAGRSKRVN